MEDGEDKVMKRVTVRPIRAGELEVLKRVAAEDNHAVVNPTHVAVKGGEIVGYCSLAHQVTLVNLWLHSEKAGPVDSLCGLTAVESLCAEHGSRGMVLPCSEDSPFYPKMTKLGFTRLGTSSVNVKGL